jgi:L-aminopeptidase/D-esterase-like protein
VVPPRGDFAGEDLLVGDAAIQTLRGENAGFGFGHVEPTAVLKRVVPFEALDGALDETSKQLITTQWVAQACPRLRAGARPVGAMRARGIAAPQGAAPARFGSNGPVAKKIVAAAVIGNMRS